MQGRISPAQVGAQIAKVNKTLAALGLAEVGGPWSPSLRSHTPALLDVVVEGRSHILE